MSLRGRIKRATRKRREHLKKARWWRRRISALKRRATIARVSGVSAEGVALVAAFEGFSSTPYKDMVGRWTIGYGHTKGVGPATPPITQARAVGLLLDELNRVYLPHIKDLSVYGELSQRQVDALVSFIYNVGPGGISPATHVGQALRAREFRAAADHLLEWNKAGGRAVLGLTRRRQAERALFLRGTK